LLTAEYGNTTSLLRALSFPYFDAQA
jgi:hypothetical protein